VTNFRFFLNCMLSISMLVIASSCGNAQSTSEVLESQLTIRNAHSGVVIENSNCSLKKDYGNVELWLLGTPLAEIAKNKNSKLFLAKLSVEDSAATKKCLTF